MRKNGLIDSFESNILSTSNVHYILGCSVTRLGKISPFGQKFQNLSKQGLHLIPFYVESRKMFQEKNSRSQSYVRELHTTPAL
jgi:hypothetical protein